MLTRLTHAAIAFALTAVVYQAYVLIAAPLIDPPRVVQPYENLTPEQRDARRQPTHKHRKLLAAYFPPQHWTLSKPPITIESGKAMIVLDESDNYQPGDDGQLRVRRCVMLFFPRGRVQGDLPPTDTVILEAPHGAVLQMDQGNSRSFTSIGSLQWAKLTGQITIRSDMRQPGPEDDLLLTTRDLYMNEDLIRTDDDVDMRLGPHHGRGRELEIRLVEVERGRTSTSGPSIGGIDSLEILKNVEAQLVPGRMQLAPGQVQLGFQNSSNNAPPQKNAPPVNITCKGRFRFNFSTQKATFSQQVRLEQTHPQGQRDRLQCEELSVYFANPEFAGSESNKTTDTPFGKLSPGLIEALGNDSTPVELDAPSQKATARCGRMRIELQPQRITFDRGHEVVLTYQGNEIHAKQVQYQAPPKNSDHRIGNLLAAGSGWLRAITSDRPDAAPFEVRWTENMRLRRINDQPVLSLNGRPRLDMVGMGQLWADHLDLYLRERATDGSEADLLPADVVPDHLVASGQIAIDAAQLRGKVKQLKVRFEYTPTRLLLASPDGKNSPRRLGSNRRSVGDTRAYDITGDTLQMLVTLRNRQPEVTSIDVNGKVVFAESSANTPGQQPLRVLADHLRIKNADSPDAEISLEGKPATITAAGMAIRTQNLTINRGTSSVRIDTPGQIELLVDRDLAGKPLATPQPLVIDWQQGMRLDQDRITFNGNVHVQTPEGALDTQQMVVQLTAPVQFDGASRQQRAEIAQLQCSGGVNAQFSQRDAKGLTSVQTIELEESFSANLQTGQLRGEGPGLLESVHLSTGDNPLVVPGSLAGNGAARLASARPQSPQPQSSQQRLRFLGVQFVRGIRGSLHNRQVQVYGNVEAVYGPVDSWQQRLALTKRGLPGPETIWISSQKLGVAESPLARLDRNKKSGLGPIELLAEGDVTIEGTAPPSGNFTTHSKFAKYDQLKTLFVLEGDNRLPATLTHQDYRGAQPSTLKARKITYNQSTGKKNIEGLMSGQLRQLAPTPRR